MKKRSSKGSYRFIVVSLATGLTIAVLTLFLFWWIPGHRDSGSSEVEDSDETGKENSASELRSEDVDLRNGRDNAVELSQAEVLKAQKSSDPLKVINEAFAYERPIKSAIEEAARNGLLTYEQMMANLAMWEPLCSKVKQGGNHVVGAFIRDGENRIEDRIIEFCRDFSEELKRHIDDSVDVQLLDGGANAVKSLRYDLDPADPDRAVQSAIKSLDRALERLDYATVFEILWFMGIEIPVSTNEAPGGARLESVSNDPMVLHAVSAALLCRQLRGCRADHPVSVGLCFISLERPCQNVQSVEDAINQVLTGLEVGQFVSMFNWVEDLLVRHRAGDF